MGLRAGWPGHNAEVGVAGTRPRGPLSAIRVSTLPFAAAQLRTPFRVIRSITKANAWREVAWIAGGQAAGALGAIIGIRLITSYLSPQAYGELVLGLTVATLGSQVVFGPLANAAERFFAPARETGRIWAFMRALRTLALRGAALVLALGVALCLGLVGVGRADWLMVAAGAAAFAILSGGEAILDGVQNAARRRSLVAVHQALRQWVRPALAVMLLSLLATTSGVAMLAYGLASISVLCSEIWYSRSTLRAGASDSGGEFASGDLQRKMLAYATPFSLWGLFTWMQVSSDRWALQLTGSSTDVGLYAVLFQIGSYPMTLLGSMLVQLVAPIIFARAGDATDTQRIRGALRLCVLLAAMVLGATIVLSLVAAVAHDQVFGLLVGPQYRSASPWLPLAVLGSGLFGVGQMLSLIPMAHGDSRALLAPKIGTAILAIGFNGLGAYAFGVPGVVVANLLFAICFIVWVTWVSYNLRPPLSERAVVAL